MVGENWSDAWTYGHKTVENELCTRTRKTSNQNVISNK